MSTLRLARLSLEGFKSFAGRIDLPFPGALIAIVGPNGAGKSNICDAIAWVLGEQSARLLRSQTMADVIFAGSPQRPPQGAAEVLLTISSGDGRWSETGGALEVGRRVFRDGTSEYRLQGRRARLKDVMDALFDAGLGTRAYAIIEQGRIGQVLSLRANERRALFEEAAGITKFRVRRHEAELKLAETRANLLRITDIASEVRRSLETVRRQARRAEQYFATRNDLLEVRAALLAGRRHAVVALLAEREQAAVDAMEREVAAAATLAEAEAALERSRQDLEALRERLAAARRDEADANAAAQRREAEETAARRELDDALARTTTAAAELARLDGELRALGARSKTLEDAVAAAVASQTAAVEAAAEAETVAARAADEAQRAAALAESGRRELLASLATVSEARQRAHRLEVEGEQNQFQKTRLVAEEERLRAHLSQLASAEDEAAAQLEAAEGGARRIDEARQGVQRRHEELLAASAETSRRRDEAGHACWQARHEREGLQRQLAAARTLPQALARALPADAVLGTVADFLEPSAEMAPLLDRAYGDQLSLPVLRDQAALDLLAGRLDRLDGRVEVVVADREAAPRRSPLLEAAGARDEDLGWLSRALPRAAAAASDAEAAELAAGDPDLVVVPPSRGRRRGGHVLFVAGKLPAPGLLELRTRERAAATAEQKAAAMEQALTAELEVLRLQTADLHAQLAAGEEEARKTADAVLAARSSREARHRERQRLEKELEVLGVESARLVDEAAALTERLRVARDEVERLSSRAGEMEHTVEAASRDLGGAREAAAAAGTAVERARGLVAVARERLTAAEREQQRHLHEIETTAARQADAATERAAQDARAAQARDDIAQARADLATLLAARSEASRRAERQTQEEAAARDRVAALAAEADTLRHTHLAVRDALHAAEIAVAEVKGEAARIEEAAALTLGGAAELPAEPPAPAELPALEQRESTLAADLAALGPVNELAVSERDALEERHTFLRTQRRDLERSLESLTATIHELDDTCAARFLATLEEASRTFGEVFRTLFGGGDAYVELADPETPLDSGIEVRVRPPGKHTQSVLLLSGGEKALAAVALLLALFRIHPAPFCVLDEVDAPLDDANVERLCQLLRDMSASTQFVLVTHNRRTMAHADVLYGVTMEEPGVSRIVSVRLED